MKAVSVTDGVDISDQVRAILLCAFKVTRLVNQPSNRRVSAQLCSKLFRPNPCGMNEIRPPMIVRLGLVLLPLMHGNPPNDDDPFALREFRSRNRADEGEENSDQEEPFCHEFWSSTIYAHTVLCNSGQCGSGLCCRDYRRFFPHSLHSRTDLVACEIFQGLTFANQCDPVSAHQCLSRQRA